VGRFRGGGRPADPLPIRIMHWVEASAIIGMIVSGWPIYDASLGLPFTFRR
jgi:thiosulfate reductase cytochrome b subunit